MSVVSFHIDDELNAQLSELAKYTDRSKSYVMRKALEYFVQTHPIPKTKKATSKKKSNAKEDTYNPSDFFVFS